VITVDVSQQCGFEATDFRQFYISQITTFSGGYNDEIEGKLKGILDSFKATQSW
jgi:hypothetical protein